MESFGALVLWIAPFPGQNLWATPLEAGQAAASPGVEPVPWSELDQERLGLPYSWCSPWVQPPLYGWGLGEEGAHPLSHIPAEFSLFDLKVEETGHSTGLPLLLRYRAAVRESLIFLAAPSAEKLPPGWAGSGVREQLCAKPTGSCCS